MTTEQWIISHASLRGASHNSSGLPCQDSISHAVTGKWYIGVVSDGAGSAPKSHFGSRLVADTVVADLKKELSGAGQPVNSARLQLLVHQAIDHSRTLLQGKLQKDESLRDYHCTLVGMVAGDRGGLFFHVGDGLGMAAVCKTDAADRTVSYWDQTSLSLPENGEYANETYFVTQEDWEAHLRFKVINAPQDIVILASDGPMSLLLQNGKPNSGFIDVVLEYLGNQGSDEERNSYIKKVLSAPQVDVITNDDKSLLIAVRPHICGLKVKKESSPLKPSKTPVTSPTPADSTAATRESKKKSIISPDRKIFSKKQTNTASFLSVNPLYAALALLAAFLLGSCLTWLLLHRSPVASKQTVDKKNHKTKTTIVQQVETRKSVPAKKQEAKKKYDAAQPLEIKDHEAIRSRQQKKKY